MHAALLANTAWLDEELTTLKHLEVGLIDEQVRVTEVVPDRLPLEETGDFVERVAWRESRWPALSHERIVRLDEPLEALGVDLVHALDGRMWRSALALSERMSVPVVLGASSHLDLRPVEQLAGRINPQRTAFTASTEPIGQALRQRVGDATLVRTIPYGIYPGDEHSRDRFTSEALCAIVAGNGVRDSHYQALLEAMIDFVDAHPDAQFFFDGQDSDQHQVWKAASQLGLLANVSLIPRRLGHRELLLRADVFLQPQPLGKSRSITLRAMAHGVTIIAHDDHWLDYLIEDQTAWLVREPTAEAWASLLRRLIEKQSDARKLGDRARKWVGKHCPASKQVAGVLDTYRRLTGDTIKFPESSEA